MSYFTLPCKSAMSFFVKNPAKKQQILPFFFSISRAVCFQWWFSYIGFGATALVSFFHRSESLTILTPLIVQEALKLQQGEAALTDRDTHRHRPLGATLRATTVLLAHVRYFSKPPFTCSKFLV